MHKQGFKLLVLLVLLVLFTCFFATFRLDTATPEAAHILYGLRLPRLILAMLVGVALSVSGVSFQSLLKNPLADPYILGISGGAGLGYVLAVILKLPFVLVPIMGYAFALVALILVYRMATVRGVLSVVNLLLIGVVFNAFSFALILILNAVANFGQAQQILYLLLGSVDVMPISRVIGIGVVTLVLTAVLWLKAPKLDLLALGEEEAFHLGLNVEREKKIVFVVTSLLVGLSVSYCGLIGFVGLIVPHLSRLLFGARHHVVLPASALLGALLLLVCDFVATYLFSYEALNTRLPVGAVTALIGAPVFVMLMKRRA